MMLKRSSHMPMRTRTETTNSALGRRRAGPQKNSNGANELQRYCVTTRGAYVPVCRHRLDARSKTSPLYHAVKASHT